VRYRAEIYRDGDGADFRRNPFAFVRDTREVTSADALTLVLAPGGGQAIRFTPLQGSRRPAECRPSARLEEGSPSQGALPKARGFGCM
jgi:hypothetical protein